MINLLSLKTKTAVLLKKLFKKASKSRIRKRAVIFTAVIVFAVVILPITPFSTMTFAYELKVDNEIIGIVPNEGVVKKAEKIVKSEICDVEITPEYSRTLVISTAVDSADDISKRIIENKNILSAYGIYANDKCIALSDSKTVLLNALEVVKNKAVSGKTADLIEFSKNVEIRECLSVKKDIDFDFNSIISKIEKKVDVKLGYITEKKVKIKYKTVSDKDNSLYKGVTVVDKNGEDGLKIKESVTYYKNGKKTQVKVLNETVVKKAVKQIQRIGTKKRPEASRNGGIYVWPLEKGAYCYISSGFGERSGRLHKGIDIIADRGTAILAAEDGRVVRSSWFESYGYCVDIIHDDGTLTRYAHCSSLIAKVGQRVVAGEVIALVGSTGRSTANHLHFEVHPNNGAPVNPNCYVNK